MMRASVILSYAKDLLFAVMLLLWSVSGAQVAFAQHASVDTLVPLSLASLHEPAIQRRVRASIDSLELAAALRKVAAAGDLDFVWDTSLPELHRRVTLQADSITLGAAVVVLLERGGATLSVEVLFSPPSTLVLRRAGVSEPRLSGARRTTGALEGVVENAETGEPVAGASVRVAAGGGAWTDDAGRFVIRDLPAGLHTLIVRRLGFAPVRIPGVGIADGVRGSVMLVMHPAAALFDAVITTATWSAFDDVGRAPSVTREQFATMPQLAEDALRAVARLPGVAADDYGARLHIRGGTGDDVLYTIDGLELIEPFHLRDLGAAVSLVDARTVGRLQLAAGDVGAEYGNRLAGVVAIESIDPGDGPVRDDATIDMLHSSVRSHGTFAQGRAAWLVTGRYGFPARALRPVDPANAFHPRYADLFAKTRFVAGGDTLAIHVLAAGDRAAGAGGHLDSLHTSARHVYLWATEQHTIGARADVRQSLAVGEVRTSRNAQGITFDTVLVRSTPPVPIEVDVADTRTSTVAAFRQDWRVKVAPSLTTRFGFALARHGAEYDYLHSTGGAHTSIALSPSTWLVGAHATQRFPIGYATITEIGARYDRQGSTNEAAWSPRVHVAHAFDERTTLRLAWGRYAQFERVYELQVDQRDTVFQQGDRAEHRGIGVEHSLRGGPTLKIEVYEHNQGQVRPRFFDPLLIPNPTPEARFLGMVRLAPLRRRSHGVELSAATPSSRVFSWRASYAFTSATDSFDDRTAPSPFEQRHGVNLESAYSRDGQWSVGASWQWRSGWPFTEARTHLVIHGDTLSLRTDYGPVNGARLPAYHRLDIRAERQWLVGGAHLATYVDVFNVYNRANPAATISVDVQGVENAAVGASADAQMLRILPNVGVRWQF